MKTFKQFKEEYELDEGNFDPEKFKAAMDKTNVKVDMTGGRHAREKAAREIIGTNHSDYTRARGPNLLTKTPSRGKEVEADYKKYLDYLNKNTGKVSEEVSGEEFGITVKSGSKKTKVTPKPNKEWPVANPNKPPFTEEVDFDKPAPVPSHFTVTHRKTGVVKKYKTRASANKAADNEDNIHGSYITSVKAIYEEVSTLTFEQFEQIAEISSRLQSKWIKSAEPKATADAIEAEYLGNKQAKAKADKTLKAVSALKTKRLFPESVDELEAARHEVLDHVTNTVPSISNITKMHDLVRKVQKLGGSANNEYDNIAHNITASQKYRDAASE